MCACRFMNRFGGQKRRLALRSSGLVLRSKILTHAGSQCSISSKSTSPMSG